MDRLWRRSLAAFGGAFLLVFTLFLLLLARRAPADLLRDPRLVRWEAAYALSTLAVFAAVGYALSWFSTRPLVALSDQLDQLDPGNVNRKLRLPDDSAEMRRLTEQVNDLLSRVHVALLNLNQYSAQVAHELRTPLTVIRLKIEQAAEKIDPALAEELEVELTRLTLHVERSLLLARAEQGHLPLHRSRFDLEPVLTNLAEGFRLLAADQGREVLISGKGAEIDADPSYMKQILYNLFANALRHGQGPIRARLKTRGSVTRLTIGNAVKAIDSRSYNLGLGKRIVEALADLHGNLRVRHHNGGAYYVACLDVRERPRALLS